jgi:hypothetical protein
VTIRDIGDLSRPPVKRIVSQPSPQKCGVFFAPTPRPCDISENVTFAPHTEGVVSNVTLLVEANVIQSHFTTGQLARQMHEPEWRVRRAVDALGEEIPRAGLYRLVPASMVPAVQRQLSRKAAQREAAR